MRSGLLQFGAFALELPFVLTFLSHMFLEPLYVVGAADLGTHAEALDNNLTNILKVSAIWGAVVLIDEADVFLQARDKMDVSRNALVSIFLRQVEYYRGILIFTTNLIESIDPAFESTCRQY